MGTSLSRVKHNRRTTEKILGFNNNNDKSVNGDDVSSTDLHFVGELVAERYLILLTEQMTEMLFRLMNFNETPSIAMSEILMLVMMIDCHQILYPV
jgi:hypothetical protein